MSDNPNNAELKGFFVRKLDAGVYSVRLDLVYLVEVPQLVRTFQYWLSTRASTDKIYMYLENGATGNLWSSGPSGIRNVANLVKSIQLSPAYDNLTLIVSQMITGAGAYLILSTPKVKWGPLGCVLFEGWLSGKSIEDYDQSSRSDIVWIKGLFRKGVKYKLFNEKDVKDHEDGRAVVLTMP